jgi:predicted CXXCH cytochrome family protein
MLKRKSGIGIGSLILAAMLLHSPPVSGEDSCRACHLAAGDELAAPVHAMDQNDIHASRNFSCADCHGGDPTAEDAEVAMSPRRGFIGVPGPSQIPQLCASCHANPEIMRRYSVSLPTDQLEKYWTSKHGIALKKGDTKVATCVSCHGTHTIYAANNPKSSVWHAGIPQTCRKCHGDAALMSQYQLPSDTYEQYAQGVHGIALLEKNDVGAPACNDCHGNHGAAPPGYETVAQVCRGCHPVNAEYFLKSPHKKAFDELGLPECAACHSNHLILKPSDDWLGVEGEHSCGQCHTKGDAGFTAASAIKGWVDSLRVTEETAAALVEKSLRRGIDVSDAQDALKQGQDALLKSRAVIHTVNAGEVEGTVQEGLVSARKALSLGQAAWSDFEYRKRGLGIATIFITLLILAIWLKVRRIEKDQGGSTAVFRHPDEKKP